MLLAPMRCHRQLGNTSAATQSPDLFHGLLLYRVRRRQANVAERLIENCHHAANLLLRSLRNVAPVGLRSLRSVVQLDVRQLATRIDGGLAKLPRGQLLGIPGEQGPNTKLWSPPLQLLCARHHVRLEHDPWPDPGPQQGWRNQIAEPAVSARIFG